MNEDTLNEAVRSAEEFLRKCLVLRCTLGLNDNKWPGTGSRETGAVKRASMDLTRALADLRKPS